MTSIKESMPVLLSGTPLSHDLLKAGWPYFSFSEKTEILTASSTVGRYMHGEQFLKELALSDENPLIRRLAAQWISEPRADDLPDMPEEKARDQALWERVRKDPDERVRHPWSAVSWGLRVDVGIEPGRFWSLPQYSRLLVVHGSNDAKWLGETLQHAVKKGILGQGQGQVPVLEALDVLLEFLHWHQEGGSGLGSSRWKDHPEGLPALWEVAIDPGLPKRLRDVLLQELPGEGLPSAMHDKLVQALTTKELVRLLERWDFEPEGYPFSLRLAQTKADDDDVRKAAFSPLHLRIPDNEFGADFPKPTDTAEERQGKLRRLHFLALNYQGATLAQMTALSVLSGWHHKEWNSMEGEHAILTPGIGDRVSRRVARVLKPWEVRDEAVHARWVLLAGDLANPDPEGRRGFPEGMPKHLVETLRKAVLPGDLWGTFTGLIRSGRTRSRWATQWLPTLEDVFDYEAVPVQHRGREADDDKPIDLAREAERQLQSLSKDTRVTLDLVSYAFNRLQEEVATVRDLCERPTPMGPMMTSQAPGWTLLRMAYWGLLAWVLFLALRFFLRH